MFYKGLPNFEIEKPQNDDTWSKKEWYVQSPEPKFQVQLRI